MPDRFEVYKETNDRFQRILKKFALIEQHPREYGTDEPLSNRRIHLIAAVGQKPLMTVTRVARLMGITKGAASLLVSAMANEGYISKMHTVENNKEVRLILTQKGQIAHIAHENFHKRVFEKFADGVTIEEAENFNIILKKFEAYADYYLANRGF